MNLYEMEQFAEDAFRVKKTYVDVAGDLNAGILLGQIVYWFRPSKDGSSKITIERDGKPWIAKKRSDWWGEVRLSDRQYDRAIEILKKHGLVEVQLYTFKGAPIPHIHLNEGLLWERVRTILRIPSNAFNGKRQMHFTQNVKSTIQRLHTETTAETTMPAASSSPVSETPKTDKKKDGEVMDAFLKAFGKMPNAFQLDKISDHLDGGMEPELLILMFEKSALKGAKFDYADSALVRMFKNKIMTVADYEAHETKRRSKNEVNRGSAGTNEKSGGFDYKPKQRDYSDVDLDNL